MYCHRYGVRILLCHIVLIKEGISYVSIQYDFFGRLFDQLAQTKTTNYRFVGFLLYKRYRTNYTYNKYLPFTILFYFILSLLVYIINKMKYFYFYYFIYILDLSFYINI